MIDISNDLVNIMSETNCSSAYALFVLEKENDNEQSDLSSELCKPTEIYATEQRYHMGTRHRRS